MFICCLFVNIVYSTRFNFINTKVPYQFAALLKFTYIMYADLLE